jgi:hypothetical protein
MSDQLYAGAAARSSDPVRWRGVIRQAGAAGVVWYCRHDHIDSRRARACAREQLQLRRVIDA